MLGTFLHCRVDQLPLEVAQVLFHYLNGDYTRSLAAPIAPKSLEFFMRKGVMTLMVEEGWEKSEEPDEG